VERMETRLDVRISQADRDAAKAIGKRLGLTCSAYVRMALKERAALETALLKHDERGGTDDR
jgi:antitoxin component of RelBE/YafQ-DinJ toxin-antitoxin module